MNQTNHTASTEIRCPRCGYDQRGVISTWLESCPMQGTCAECGLNIEWAEILSAKLKRPHWCLEYAESLRDGVGRTVASIGTVFLPWLMWRSLKMSHPPRIRRLLLVIIMFAATFALLAYLSARINASAQMYYRFARQPNCTVNVGFWTVCAQSVFSPWSHQSPGTVTFRGMVRPYPSPSEYSITAFTIMRQYWWITKGPLQRDALAPLPYCVLLLAIFPLGFLILPRTRRKAKVRWIHLLRIWLYGLFWLIAPVSALLIANHLAGWDENWSVRMYVCFTALVYVGTPLFIMLFWQAAVRRYLRMPHSVGVAFGVGAITWLLAQAILFYAANPISPSEFLELSGKAIWGPQYRSSH
jgi:hypothetical protein